MVAPVSAPRRNVELKAMDPDPARSLAVCRELGVDRGAAIAAEDDDLTGVEREERRTAGSAHGVHGPERTLGT